jgi:hypothetical protein
MQYRLYIDESGNHGYGDLASNGGRYLALTGLMIDSEVYRTQFHPGFEQMKQETIPHDPDNPVIFHRRDIIDRIGPFKVLQDASVRQHFDDALLAFIDKQHYKIITAVIDKKQHIETYGGAAFHPYHYCLTVLMERYCGFLHRIGKKGSVLAESRGRSEDNELKNAFDRLLVDGTQWRSADFFKGVLTDHTLKTARKSSNIAGLQLADLLVYPSKEDVLAEHGRIPVPQGVFREKLGKVMRHSYNRHMYDGRIKGYGMILL